MKHHEMLPFRTALGALATLIVGVRGLSQQYCSGQNTGADHAAVRNIYNSNLACSNQCKGSYAFAVVQYQNCWCSNYAPSSLTSVGSCSQTCPGYPGDDCGNEAENLFGYIALSLEPSGTAGAGAGAGSASSSTSTSASEASPSTDSVSLSSGTESEISSVTSTLYSPRTTGSSASSTSFPSTSPAETSSLSSSVLTPLPPQSSATTVEPSSTSTTSFSRVPTSSSSSPPPPTTSSSSSSTPSPSSSSSPPPPPTSSTSSVSSTTVAPIVVPVTTSSSTTASTHSPVTSVEVVTVSGAVVTQTVTSTPTSVVAGGDTSGAASPPTLQRMGLSGGAIAGIVIGVLVGLLVIALAAALLWRRQRRRDTEDATGTSTGQAKPKRNISVLSRSGLLSHGRPPSMAEREDDAPYANTGNNSVRHSMIFGGFAAAEGVSPTSVLDSSGDVSNSSRRNSRPLVYDQRLNPSALFANAEANGSRVSMQDQQDYSRPLGVANPDFRASFDSRHSHG